MEKSQLRTLILDGADFLEKYPERYNFWENRVCHNGPVCMIGAMAQNTDTESGTSVFKFAETIGLDTKAFLYGIEDKLKENKLGMGTIDGKVAAIYMQWFADKHYPVE